MTFFVSQLLNLEREGNVAHSPSESRVTDWLMEGVGVAFYAATRIDLVVFLNPFVRDILFFSLLFNR